MSRSDDLKSAKRQKEQEIKSWEKRKEQVQDILMAVRNDFDGEIDKVNRKLADIAEQQENGFIGFSHIESVSVRIRTEKEKSTYSDLCMSDVSDQLSQDIREAEKKINGLRQDISNLNGQIQAAEAEEAEARRKALEEMFAKLTGQS